MTVDYEFKSRACYRRDGDPKFSFYSRKEAKAAAKNLSGNPHPYRCPYCGHFHLGRSAPRVAP